MSKSPLSGLLDAAFGPKAAEAAVILNNMESHRDQPNDRIPPEPKKPSLVRPTVERSTDERTSYGAPEERLSVDSTPVQRTPVERDTVPQERPTVDHNINPIQPRQYVPRSTVDRSYLTPTQEEILNYLIAQPMQRATRRGISETLGIPFATVRDTLKRLGTLGYITQERRADRFFQGLVYDVNIEKCNSYFSRVGRSTVERSPSTVERSDVHISSSSKDFKSTTTGASYGGTSTVPSSPSDLSPVAIMLKDPEHGFWREAGIMPRQVETWLSDTGMTIEQMDLSLRHCRYAILNKEGEEVREPLSWFWKTIQRAGFYPRPEGYKSLEEQRSEEMMKVAREQVEARRRRQRAELEMEFEQIISDPGGEEYQELLKQLPEFARMQKGLLLEKNLHSTFFENAGFPPE